MREKLAFTASFWGDSAVVCRASEDRPAPVVNQEFGRFETWTQASAFAAGLNDGFDLDCAEVRDIVTSAYLRRSTLLNSIEAGSCTCAGGTLRPKPLSPRMQFVLAELALAITFCRIGATSQRSTQAARLRRNARKALFDALHFVLQSNPCSFCMEKLSGQISILHSALQDTCIPTGLDG
jgi:hypothetical protein